MVVRRIKEKYGALRFIFDGGDAFYRDAVAIAEEHSLHICELRNLPGELYWHALVQHALS